MPSATGRSPSLQIAIKQALDLRVSIRLLTIAGQFLLEGLTACRGIAGFDSIKHFLLLMLFAWLFRVLLLITKRCRRAAICQKFLARDVFGCGLPRCAKTILCRQPDAEQV